MSQLDGWSQSPALKRRIRNKLVRFVIQDLVGLAITTAAMPVSPAIDLQIPMGVNVFADCARVPLDQVLGRSLV